MKSETSNQVCVGAPRYFDAERRILGNCQVRGEVCQEIRKNFQPTESERNAGRSVDTVEAVLGRGASLQLTVEKLKALNAVRLEQEHSKAQGSKIKGMIQIRAKKEKHL